jgi:5-formyltetrahydrofolate cyclo-ligase
MADGETVKAKQQLREVMRARRAEVPGPERLQAARDVARHVLAILGADFAGTVGAYFPTGDELDSLPLLHLLSERGIATALPVAEKRNHPLQFYPWQAGEPLEKAAFGIEIPLHRDLSVRPDVLIIPLLAFDHTGARLGYGGGYYDRTLEEWRRLAAVLAVGVGYAFQLVASLPAEPHDERLDWLVTPAGSERVR